MVSLNENKLGCYRGLCPNPAEYTAWLAVGRKDGEPGRGYIESDMKVCGDHRYTTTIPMFLRPEDRRVMDENIEREAAAKEEEPVMPDWDTVELEWRSIQ